MAKSERSGLSVYWLVTYYSGADWVFDIDTIQNEITESQGQVVTSSFSKDIDTKTVRHVRYTNLSGLTSGAIAGIVIGASIGAAIIILACIFCLIKCSPNRAPLPPPVISNAIGTSQQIIRRPIDTNPSPFGNYNVCALCGLDDMDI